ncbi:three-helix bundle dimerization domain-containing protein [Rhodococcus artemisiae]|uniref:Uncharacterized protein n=1 Tax=Rhodococcus artemisiae TaxID=714159 RepID=A0ABU7LA14_9NOCA|nr:hypothetical protein [Rhodococcus artemisiae]MEE2058393.1 hypothetical protein [Rhodococcus artemisiae]
MTGEDELLQVEQIIERLLAQYRAVQPEVVENTVRSIHKRFADASIRDFVPLLVEKASRRAIIEGAQTLGKVSGPVTIHVT